MGITWGLCQKTLGVDIGHLSQKMMDMPVNAIAHDGRLATEFDVFVPLLSVQGSVSNFAKQALQGGCRAMVVDQSMAHMLQSIPLEMVVVVPDIHDAMRQLYPLFYPDFPAHRVAITGTDGKTSTAHFLHQIWSLTGTPSAAMGTMGVFSNPEFSPKMVFPPRMTTPQQPFLYALLSECKKHGIDHVVFEATSQALAQSRLEPLRASVAIMTNFAQDHLDYHGNLEAYWSAKWCLFRYCMVEKEPCYALIHNSIKIRPSDHECVPKNVSFIRYGPKDHAIVGAQNATYRIVEKTPQGQIVDFDCIQHRWTCLIPLIGHFQIDNVLAALIAFVCAGGKIESAISALSGLKAVLGRMEHVTTYQGGHIYVDYAHTPQALALALQTLRQYTSGKLGVVFGCGGDRDATKRPLMGQAAAEHSDWVIVTDDNPRNEDPDSIRKNILIGCPHADSIGPRSAALVSALQRLQPGDVLLISGKGHETTQTIGDHILHHSDQEWVRDYCRKGN
jgi:UDP-N-acetylmuramoyl-L-alanyl-D-glutamate--2,6-diaminopimelate ligase